MFIVTITLLPLLSLDVKEIVFPRFIRDSPAILHLPALL